MSIPNITAGEAQLRMLIDNIPARVALMDRERRHCYVNQEYIQFVGRPVEAILGRTVGEITAAEPFAGFLDLGEKALTGETAWEGWMPHTTLGRRVPSNASMCPLPGKQYRRLLHADPGSDRT